MSNSSPESTTTRRPRSCLGSFVLLLVVAALLIVTVGGVLAIYLPQRAGQVFGPPSPHLDRIRVAAYSALLLVQSGDLTRPVNPNGPAQPFQVAPGESTPSVVGRLWDEGFITNPGAFSTYLRYSGLDTSLKSGSYQLSPAMSPVDIAHALQTSVSPQVDFVVLPGWRLEEIAASLPSSGLEITPHEFMAAAARIPEGYTFSNKIPDGATLEGFLLPGTYVVDRKATPDQLIQAMLDQFDSQVSSDLRQGFKRQGLSLFQAVTLASMVQREAMQDDEMPLIASVFYNRLAAGMKLASDPTVQYALGYDSADSTWWKNPLSLDDLAVTSPYNTYANEGLPPGPIANPSLTALRAVAYPAQTPYYYFRAACDNSGRHQFSETYAEHLQNECP